MPRPKNTEQRKDQIVQGLLLAMAKKGYDGATIGAIAKEAQLTSGLVHYHFQNKQQILLALVSKLMDRLEQRYQERLPKKDATAQKRLHAYLDAHVKKGPDALPAAVNAWIAVGAEAVRQPEVREVYEKIMEERLNTLRALVADVLTEQKRQTKNARTIAMGLLSAIEGAFQITGAAGRIVPSGFAAPTLRRMADGLIAAEQKEA